MQTYKISYRNRVMKPTSGYTIKHSSIRANNAKQATEIFHDCYDNNCEVVGIEEWQPDIVLNDDGITLTLN